MREVPQNVLASSSFIGTWWADMHITRIFTSLGREIKANQNCKRDHLKDLLEQWGAFLELVGQVTGFEGQGSWSLHPAAMLPPSLVIHLCVENLVFACMTGALIPYLYLLAFFCKSYFYPIVTTTHISRTMDFNIWATESL